MTTNYNYIFIKNKMNPLAILGLGVLCHSFYKLGKKVESKKHSDEEKHPDEENKVYPYRYGFPAIAFETEESALDTLYQLQEVIVQNGKITYGECLDICKCPAPFESDYSYYGWKDRHFVSMLNTPRDGIHLIFEPACFLD
jgi:hypothetical protein